MNKLTDDSINWPTIVAYALLIVLYFIILRLLLNCIQQLTKKHRDQRSVIDADIHQESLETRVDDSMVGMDIYGRTIAFLRLVLITVAILGVALILAIKLNIILAVSICMLAGLITWRLLRWKKNVETGARYDIISFVLEKFVAIGGNIGTVIFLMVALVITAFGLLFLS